jgi:hypothetical protein
MFGNQACGRYSKKKEQKRTEKKGEKEKSFF